VLFYDFFVTFIAFILLGAFLYSLTHYGSILPILCLEHTLVASFVLHMLANQSPFVAGYIDVAIMAALFLSMYVIIMV
jgi:hypothetical protein